MNSQGISIIMPHAINDENDRVLSLNQKMAKENTRGPYEILYIGNMRRPDLVYKGWNMLVGIAKYDLVLWSNTDLLLAPNWDVNIYQLTELYDWISLRVVECGAIPSAATMISKNFGWTAQGFDRDGFEKFVGEDIAQRPIHQPGWIWHCPSVLKRNKFLELGGFGETPPFPYDQDNHFKVRAEAAGWKFGVSNHSYAYHLQRARENLGKQDRA